MVFGFVRRRLAQGGFGAFIVHGGQLLLLWIGVEVGSPGGWLFVSIGVAGLSVAAWLLAIRRWRAIGDTPTSQVVSAAQGYVELCGRGKKISGTPVLSPMKVLPCLWYRLVIESRDSDGDWSYERTLTSDASILIDDGTGECLVDPEGAEVITSREDSWTDGDTRYTQWLLLEHEKLYVIGQFTTRSGLDLQLDRNEDIKQLLAEWKSDNPKLLKSFDRDKDGQLNAREWEVARLAARREVEKQHREARSSGDLHLMHYPADGRLYLISNIPAERLARRYRWWAWLHLGIFFAALAAVSTLVTRYGFI